MVQAQNTLTGRIYVEDQGVSASTTFNFDINSVSGETVASNDYMEIVIPDSLDSTFATGSPTCTVDNGSFSSCVIVNSKKCRITFSERMTTPTITGSVFPFNNPISNQD